MNQIPQTVHDGQQIFIVHVGCSQAWTVPNASTSQVPRMPMTELLFALLYRHGTPCIQRCNENSSLLAPRCHTAGQHACPDIYHLSKSPLTKNDNVNHSTKNDNVNHSTDAPRTTRQLSTHQSSLKRRNCTAHFHISSTQCKNPSQNVEHRPQIPSTHPPIPLPTAAIPCGIASRLFLAPPPNMSAYTEAAMTPQSTSVPSVVSRAIGPQMRH